MARRAAAAAVMGLLLSSCAPATSSSGGGEKSGPANRTEAEAIGLCDVLTDGLAVLALGGPVGEPTGGEVLPRPNGVYCHYALAADARVNIEVQLKTMTRAEFDALATTLHMQGALSDLAEAAYQRPSGSVGAPGLTVIAYGGGRGVVIVITGQGDPDAQLDAADVIAEAVLAS